MALAPVARIADFQGARSIVDSQGRPTTEFLRALNGAFHQLVDFDAAIAAADAAAAAANAAAIAAQDAANAVTADTSLQNSYVTGLTIESFNDGLDCHVDISAHVREYGDGTSASVNGGTLTSIPFDTIVRVYYDDPSRAGGSVTYQWTSDEAVSAQIGDRHSVGAVVTQRSTEVTSIIGSGLTPPGTVIP